MFGLRLFDRPLVALTTGVVVAICHPLVASAQPDEPEPPVAETTPAESATVTPSSEPVAPTSEPAAPEPETVAPEPQWETKLRWSGYLDVGLFGTTGDGAGHVQDIGHVIFPEHEGVGWVFHGDPLATAVNSRGEPADTGSANGTSRAVTLDSVDSNGKPTFLVNEVDIDLTAALRPTVWVMTSIDLLPRGRIATDEDGINLGDFLDIDLAFANWTAYAGEHHVVDLQVGKFDSVMGVEYRIQESPDRFGISPSLIFRYLGGHPVGVKLRSQHWDQKVIVAAAITNGSHFQELFPLADEGDSNAFKTGAARVALHHEGESVTLELGASGLFGAQDQQPTDTGIWQWQVGGDLVVTWEDFELRAEYLRGHARGETDTVPCDVAQCLRFQGAYGELAYRPLNWMGIGARVDWRDADHRFGDEFIYVVDVLRATAMARFEIGRFGVIKAEYTHAHELFGRPRIPNDVLTSSVVLTW